MTIREYNIEDKDNCLAVFDSNCPTFFDKSEREMFVNWLNHQSNGNKKYQSSTYKNVSFEAYYVLDMPKIGVIGCGGFYITQEVNEARLAWGMIHADFHKRGYGKALYLHRNKIIKQNWPNHEITLGTSQHTYTFYEKMGLSVIESIKSGYGKNLDRYDMKL